MELDGAKILVLEDEPEILEIISIGLQREGATVLDSTDFSFVETALPKFDAHIVICDQHTPKGTGDRILKKASERDPKPSCILLTGQMDAEDLAEGDTIVLLKPFRITDLLTKITTEFKNVRTRWKRRHSRVPCSINGMWIHQNTPPMKVKIADISLRGAFIQLDHETEITDETPMPKPLEIVSIQLAEKEFEGLSIQGQVRWKRRYSPGKERPCGFGVLFDSNTTQIVSSINQRIT